MLTWIATVPSVSAEDEKLSLQALREIEQRIQAVVEKVAPATVAIQIGDGLHIYGQPIPDGFYALAVTVDGAEGLESQELSLPEPQPYRVEGLDEEFVAYEGEIRGALPFYITANAGDVTLEITVS